MNRPIRFLLSRDDYYHQRGYWLLAGALRNAGMEVILGGIQTPKEIVQMAIQEDVDIIGYRVMDASPRIVIASLFEEMRENGIGDIPVVVGGIVPEKDESLIKEMGVKEVFHPHTPLEKVIEHVEAVAIGERQTSNQKGA